MKLFLSPGGCSQSCHIALVEAGLAHEIVAVDRQKRTSDGRDFRTINPRGMTPTLELADGSIVTEALAILVAIAEQAGTLLAPRGLARWRTLEATSFMTTEVHGNFRPFFNPTLPADAKERARAKLREHFAALAAELGDRAFLVGDELTIADAYLFVMLAWANLHAVEVPGVFAGYAARLRQRPAIATVLAREGLAQAA